MDTDDVMDAMGELYRDGKVDMVPTIGDVSPEEQQFTLNDDGMEYAEALLQERPELVEMVVTLHISKHGADGETLDDLFKWLRDESGVNAVRALIETDPDWFSTDDIDESFIAQYDPEGDDA